jgi:hypothetical protein
MKTAVVRIALFVGTIYLIAGIVFGELAGRAASVQMRVAWRWAAWLVSAALFGAQILYEQIRLRNSPKIAALHVSAAAALGAFGLAAAANVHAYVASAHEHALMLALSLAIWPLMTALPAFVVALVAALLFSWVRWSAQPHASALPDDR